MSRHPPMQLCLRSLQKSRFGFRLILMESSLGASFEVAISAAVFTGLSSWHVEFIDGMFWGRADNIAIRYSAAVALLFNLFMVLIAFIPILMTAPMANRG